MTPEQIEKERHAFEEWYGAPNPLKRDSNGNYLYASAHNAWTIWQAAKEHAAGQDGWISVQEKLPSPDDTVLLLDSRKNIQSGYLDGDALVFIYTDTNDWIDDGRITHWRPLPAMPISETV